MQKVLIQHLPRIDIYISLAKGTNMANGTSVREGINTSSGIGKQVFMNSNTIYPSGHWNIFHCCQCVVTACDHGSPRYGGCVSCCGKLLYVSVSQITLLGMLLLRIKEIRGKMWIPVNEQY